MASPRLAPNLNGNRHPLSIFLVAGEVSGDQSGARLAQAIQRLAPEVRLIGAGGPAMDRQGVDVQVRTADLNFIGYPASLRTITTHISAYRQVLAKIRETRPGVVVLIDNEGMNHLLAYRLSRAGVPVVFFFPPQVWFWGRWRIHHVARIAQRILTAFSEEANLYRAAGANVQWVGHPLRECLNVGSEPKAALCNVGLDPSRPLVVLMPGSRRREVEALVDIMLDAAKILKARDGSLQFGLPLASEAVRDVVERAVSRSGLSLAIYTPDSHAVLSQARVVLQCSGTASLETALLGIPSVVAYRCNPLVHFIARRMMHVPFISIANVLLQEMVQPEFFGGGVDPEQLAEAAWTLLTDDKRRGEIKARLATVPDMLGPSGACARAAEAVLDILPRNGTSIGSPMVVDGANNNGNGRAKRETPKVLLLGMGRWGLNHLRVARSLPVELFVGDLDPARLALARDAGVAEDHCSTNPLEFIEDVRAVVLATPASTHFEWCRDLMLAGKDVFIEKPLALQSSHAKALAEIAENSGVIVQVGHIFRFDPASRSLRDTIRRGDFGRLRLLRGTFSGFKRLRTDSGVLFADAIHFVDLFNFLMGRPPTSVRAECRDLLQRRMDDQVHVVLDWEPDDQGHESVFGFVEASYHTPVKTREVIVVGEELTALCDFNLARNKIRTFQNRRLRIGDEFHAIEGETSVVQFDPEEPLLIEWRAFLDSVEYRKPSGSDAWTGYETIRVLEAALESAKRGQAIRLVDQEYALGK